MSLCRTLLLTAGLLLPAHGAAAVYKSLDEHGRVSYSSTPAENHQDTVKVNILPPPSEEDIKAAEQRHQRNLRTEKILDESRQKQSQEIAEKNRIRRENNQPLENTPIPAESKEEGPYYGLPGHGILVLPKGPRISH